MTVVLTSCAVPGISDIRIIGDAFTPRRLRHAINEAHAVARSL